MCKKVWKTAARTALCLCLSLWMAMAPCAEGYAYGGKNIYQDLATEMPGAAEASAEAAPGEETPEKSGTDGLSLLRRFIEMTEKPEVV